MKEYNMNQESIKNTSIEERMTQQDKIEYDQFLLNVYGSLVGGAL